MYSQLKKDSGCEKQIQTLNSTFPSTSFRFSLLPDEELFAPGGLIRCLFFKNHWHVEPHNAFSVGRTGK